MVFEHLQCENITRGAGNQKEKRQISQPVETHNLGKKELNNNNNNNLVVTRGKVGRGRYR